MGRARSVLLILFLLAGSLSPPLLGAQEIVAAPQSVDLPRGFVLEQNYPNPVNPETWIPFTLEQSLFGVDERVVVTIRIYNILNQLVAIPDALEHPRGRGTRVFNLEYTEPGRMIAYWDGRDEAGRQVPSGVYYVQMVVRGSLETLKPQTLKLTVLNPRNRRRIFPW